MIFREFVESVAGFFQRDEVAMWTRLRRLAPVALLPAFVLFGLAGSALAQSDIEPNDTPAQAVEIPLPFYYTGGEISTLQDVDFYKFTASAGMEFIGLLRAHSIGSPLVP